MADPSSSDVHTDRARSALGPIGKPSISTCPSCKKRYGPGYHSCPHCKSPLTKFVTPATTEVIFPPSASLLAKYRWAQRDTRDTVTAILADPDLARDPDTLSLLSEVTKALGHATRVLSIVDDPNVTPAVKAAASLISSDATCPTCLTEFAAGYRLCPSSSNTFHKAAMEAERCPDCGHTVCPPDCDCETCGEDPMPDTPLAKAFGYAKPKPISATTQFRPDPRLHSHPFNPDPTKPNRCSDCGMGSGAHSRMVYKPTPATEEDILAAGGDGSAPLKKSDPDPEDLSYTVVKSRPEQRFTLGPVYMPTTIDAHGEFIDAESLQKATWNYVRETGSDRSVYLQHSTQPAGEWVEIVTWPHEVEANLTLPDGSGTVRKAKFPAGTVYMGVVWEPWAYDLVKKGQLRGYSMGGYARRVEAVMKHGGGTHDQKSHGGGSGSDATSSGDTGGGVAGSRTTPLSPAQIKARREALQAATSSGEYAMGGPHDSTKQNATEIVADSGKKHLKFTPEREAIHNELIDAAMAEAEARGVPSNRDAILMGGLGGAGKTRIIESDEVRRRGIKAEEFLVVNPDDFKERLIGRGLVDVIPGFTPMESSHLAHEESSHIASRLAERASNRGMNVIWDFTLGSSGSGSDKVADLHRNGYDNVKGIFVDVSIEKSIDSADKRWIGGVDRYLMGQGGQGGRAVPHSVIRSQAGARVGSGNPYGTQNRQAFNIMQRQGRFDSTILFDNDGDGTSSSYPQTLVEIQ